MSQRYIYAFCPTHSIVTPSCMLFIVNKGPVVTWNRQHVCFFFSNKASASYFFQRTSETCMYLLCKTPFQFFFILMIFFDNESANGSPEQFRGIPLPLQKTPSTPRHSAWAEHVIRLWIIHARKKKTRVRPCVHFLFMAFVLGWCIYKGRGIQHCSFSFTVCLFTRVGFSANEDVWLKRPARLYVATN